MTTPARPNSLWYCTDQQRFGTIRSLGNPHVRTPVIDGLYWILRRLAEERGCYPADSDFTLAVP